MEIKAMGLGLTRSILLYNRHAAPLWQYIGQLYAPSFEVLRCERKMLQRLVCGPYQSFNAEMLTG
eukprot:14581158-Heterocapsa_arctica.AAC.1